MMPLLFLQFFNDARRIFFSVETPIEYLNPLIFLGNIEARKGLVAVMALAIFVLQCYQVCALKLQNLLEYFASSIRSSTYPPLFLVKQSGTIQCMMMYWLGKCSCPCRGHLLSYLGEFPIPLDEFGRVHWLLGLKQKCVPVNTDVCVF